MKGKFNYTAQELLFYMCPCCLHKWRGRKPDYCPNCEVRMLYTTEISEEEIKNILHDAFNSGKNMNITFREYWNMVTKRAAVKSLLSAKGVSDEELRIVLRQAIRELRRYTINRPSMKTDLIIDKLWKQYENLTTK